jgi:6-phosphofructokinase 1
VSLFAKMKMKKSFPANRLNHHSPLNCSCCFIFHHSRGLNNVIRELVHSLYYLYGAKQVYGITGGFHGFHKDEFKPIKLTNAMVENIHHEGGTVLRSSRGGFDIDKILDFLVAKDISQLYVIGGDGTHR